MNVSLASLRSEITHGCVVLIFCEGVHFCKILRTRLLHVQSEEELEKKDCAICKPVGYCLQSLLSHCKLFFDCPSDSSLLPGCGKGGCYCRNSSFFVLPSAVSRHKVRNVGHAGYHSETDACKSNAFAVHNYVVSRSYTLAGKGQSGTLSI